MTTPSWGDTGPECHVQRRGEQSAAARTRDLKLRVLCQRIEVGVCVQNMSVVSNGDPGNQTVDQPANRGALIRQARYSKAAAS
jgi:hypothetical protein